MIRKIYAVLILFLTAVTYSNAQSALGEIRGVVKDKDTKEPIGFAAVVVEQNGIQAGGTVTDLEGNFSFKSLRPGKYTVKVQFVGYTDYILSGVQVTPDNITRLDIAITSGVELEPVIVTYRAPIIKEGENGQTRDADAIKKIPTRSINGVAATTAGVLSIDGGTPSFRGSRASGTAYYINGVRVIGSISLPQNGIDQTNVITGGISAEYGDFVGGAISITTPPPSSRFRMSAEVVTSSLFDRYHYNLGEFSVTGPIITKNKREKNERTILGYFVAANFNYNADGSPSAIGINKLNDQKLKELEENPIRSAPIGTGYVPSASFIYASDIEKVQARLNTASYSVSSVFNLNYAPNDQVSVVFGGTYNYFNGRNYSYTASLFNYEANGQSIQHSLLTYLTLTQQLVKPVDPSSEEAKKRTITNAFYSVSLQYQSLWGLTQDAVHKDNIFDYGYVGRFTTYRAPVYQQVAKEQFEQPDSFNYNGNVYYLKNYRRLAGYQDTSYTFDRSTTRNPIRSNYTSRYYEFLDGEIDNYGQVRGSNAGLVNGQNPLGIYSNMWTNVGTQIAGYGKSQTEQYSINAVGQVSIKGHDIRFGLYYEQRVTRSWSVGATALWQQMWLLSNRGLGLDLENPILSFTDNGVFTDSVSFNEKFNDEKPVFATRFREYLINKGATDAYGRPITQDSYVDVNSYDPSDFSLDMFSADELWNNGNNLIAYSGYDYLGNKVRKAPSVDDFINDPLNRPVGAFMPIYTAAFIQDKYVLKDLTIRAGVRIERYDANQPVLRDPFSLYPIKTAGEVTELNGNPVNHPNGIGGDYAVYVDNANNPTAIAGYRNGINWYNANGTAVTDPTIIATSTSSGTIQPLLVDPNRQEVTRESFKDFDPIFNVLPRIWFDFPVNTSSRFFANYDVIAQRPQNSFTPISDWYFLRNTPTNVINNPNLQSQLTTDYEVGFKQKIGNNSGLTLVAGYREQRNLIQLFRFNYAYPVSYISYSNIDFATIKQFRIEYEVRDLGNLSFDASYTLLFADGTGSNPASQQALVQAGQPNLRTLFPLGDIDVRNNIKLNVFYEYKNGDEYNGPVWKGKKIFQNAGVALTLNAISGLPYTANALPTPNAQSGVVVRSPIEGTPFGSRLPWQLQNDLNIYKNVNVTLGKKKDGQPIPGQLRFMFWVQNILDVQNIRAVHPYTGSPSDDGWLASSQGRESIRAAIDAQSFVDLYNVALQNPGFYGLPRRIRLSVRLMF